MDMDAGNSQTHPTPASSLRKHGFVVINNRPCKIVEMTTSKTGKHGSAKVMITGIDIFTGKQYQDICPSTHNIQVPNVNSVEYTLTEIDDEGFLSLMDGNGNTRDDIRLPADEALAAQIREGFDKGANMVLCILTAMGEQAVVSAKEV